LSVLRSAYVEGAMRTNVVSCESAAVTLLLGVLHVPQLYSLRFREGRGERVSRALFRESRANGFFFWFDAGGRSVRRRASVGDRAPSRVSFEKRARRRREPFGKKA
jgi:hypothetical protein